MSLETDLVALAATVAELGGAQKRFYPEALPEQFNFSVPACVYRRLSLEPGVTFDGSTGNATSDFIFEFWAPKTAGANAKIVAQAAANAFDDALEADFTIPDKMPIPVNGEEYDPQTLAIMEPRAWRFFHEV